MARAARNSALETRTARARLRIRRTPYFAKIAKGLRLGYYRGAVAGSWVARWYRGAGVYATEALGIADDTLEADGVGVLDERDHEEVAVVPFGVVDEAAIGVPGGAGGRADAAAAQRRKQGGVEDTAHIVGRFDLRHEQALGAGFHRASDGGFVRTARYA